MADAQPPFDGSDLRLRWNFQASDAVKSSWYFFGGFSSAGALRGALKNVGFPCPFTSRQTPR